MAVELHLPDLPEVPLSLGPAGPAAPRPRTPWRWRVREALMSYLPLLLMAALALGTWWLVKNSPKAPPTPVDRPRGHEPDYTMSNFSLERFDASGRLALRMQGSRMRHFPDSARIEIDGIRLLALAPDGRTTEAHARQAVARDDGSEVQLVGEAEVRSLDARGVPLVVRSEYLQAFPSSGRLRTNRPVRVRHGGSDLRAAGLEYDRDRGVLELRGPMRIVLAPTTP